MLARSISSEPLNSKNRRYKFGVGLGVRNNSAVVTAQGAFRAREVRRTEQQERWDNRQARQIDPLPPPPVPFEGGRGRKSSEQTLILSVPLQDARVAMRSDLESEHKPTLTPAALESRNVSKQLRKDLSAWIEEERC